MIKIFLDKFDFIVKNNKIFLWKQKLFFYLSFEKKFKIMKICKFINSKSFFARNNQIVDLKTSCHISLRNVSLLNLITVLNNNIILSGVGLNSIQMNRLIKIFRELMKLKNIHE